MTHESTHHPSIVYVLLSSAGVTFHILWVNSCKIHMHNPPKKLGMSMGLKQKYTPSLNRMRSALLRRCCFSYFVGKLM